MLKYAPLQILALSLLTASLCSLAADSPRASKAKSLAALPPTMLWAWERREDMRWLPADVGVAYVATTLELEADTVRLRPRAWPLMVRPDTAVIPMVHVDASWRQPPALTPGQHAAVVEQVLKAARRSATRVVQLDFEVRRSQRGFLQAVVRDIQQRLPNDVALSVTALASWCAGDYWIGALEADEIVPMAFRMARDEGTIRSLLATHGGFVRPRCKGALGMATDEPRMQVAGGRRYFFSPRSWDQDTWRDIQ
jgi:hypothetical protein